MRPSLFLRASLLALGLLAPVIAQQYQGDVIPNRLLKVTGAEIAYFNIKDAKGKNTTLINYFSLPTTTGKRPDPTKIKRLVVVLHGANRDAWNYFNNVYGALRNAVAYDPEVNEESVAILSPFFPNRADRVDKYPYPDGKSNTSVLVWGESGWSAGENNVFPSSQKTVSSFDALDQILRHYDDASIYPNIHQFVVAGHSLGAQMTQRYAAVGKELGLRTPVVYWLGNPGSLLWFNDKRPLSTAGCETYNDWRDGLANYDNVYERDFVRNHTAVLARYSARDIAMARGLNDFGDPASGCSPSTTGANRGERLYNFIAAFPPDAGDTVDYVPGAGHGAVTMMSRESGVRRLFLDNFNGNGSRAADFGPRQVTGDNPHPKARN